VVQAPEAGWVFFEDYSALLGMQREVCFEDLHALLGTQRHVWFAMEAQIRNIPRIKWRQAGLTKMLRFHLGLGACMLAGQ